MEVRKFVKRRLIQCPNSDLLMSADNIRKHYETLPKRHRGGGGENHNPHENIPAPTSLPTAPEPGQLSLKGAFARATSQQRPSSAADTAGFANDQVGSPDVVAKM